LSFELCALSFSKIMLFCFYDLFKTDTFVSLFGQPDPATSTCSAG
jgi:hypothetical protein